MWKRLLQLALVAVILQQIYCRTPYKGHDFITLINSSVADLTRKPPMHYNVETAGVRCNITINKTSSSYLKNAIEEFHPNFAKLQLRFRYVHRTDGPPYILEPSTSFTEDIIQPYQLVWTYYSPEAYFPYLKWSVDFPILSFGLLDAKTLYKHFLVVEIHEQNCSVVLGTHETTLSIALALRELTKDYLLDIKRDFSNTYWCYLAVIPGVKDTLGYQLGIYFAYPVAFARYNCCRTQQSKTDNASLSIQCQDHLVGEMWQGTIIPYILALVAFAYFPIVLFNTSARFISIGKNDDSRQFSVLDSNDEEDINKSKGDCVFLDGDCVFLDGRPPISLTIIVGGMCGLADKYPITVSRLRRCIFLLLAPCVIFCQLCVYYHFQYDTTMALLEHGCPMGYLSMLGGFKMSITNFLPILGGPFILMFVFYTAGVFFIIAPNYPNRIAYAGTIQHFSYGKISPLSLHIETVESYSHTSIANEKCGYKRIALINIAMFYMVMNPVFWYNAVRIQFTRFMSLLELCSSVAGKLAIVVLLSPVYIALCVAELGVCVVYYGIPLINAMTFIITGYIVWLTNFCRRRRDISDSIFWVVFNSCTMKSILATIVTILFIYYVISVCTIFILSFSFIAKVLVFSLLSIIIYPTTSFGYLFFGIMFLYYILKTIQGFGDRYVELLADAVEVSSQLESDVFRNKVVDNTVIIDDIVHLEITKLQIRNRVIDLTTAQSQAIRDTDDGQRSKLIYRNHEAGIPRDLFNTIVNKYHPVHIQITHALLKIFLIMALISVTISVIVAEPFSPGEGISDMMHVVFIVVVGALPRILEVAFDNVNHSVKKEIELRKLRTTINEYWTIQTK